MGPIWDNLRIPFFFAVVLTPPAICKTYLVETGDDKLQEKRNYAG